MRIFTDGGGVTFYDLADKYYVCKVVAPHANNSDYQVFFCHIYRETTKPIERDLDFYKNGCRLDGGRLDVLYLRSYTKESNALKKVRMFLEHETLRPLPSKLKLAEANA